MPVEIGLEMYAEKELLLPHFTRHVARGLLLHLVGRVDPSASQRLHAPNVVKPYSVAPLRFKSKAKSEAGYLLDPAFSCRVQFRFLEDEYARYVVDFLGSGTLWRLGTSRFISLLWL